MGDISAEGLTAVSVFDEEVGTVGVGVAMPMRLPEDDFFFPPITVATTMLAFSLPPTTVVEVVVVVAVATVVVAAPAGTLGVLTGNMGELVREREPKKRSGFSGEEAAFFEVGEVWPEAAAAAGSVEGTAEEEEEEEEAV